MKLEGKVAIVTGSGRGIGRSIAMAFAKEGAKVTVADLKMEDDGPIPGSIKQAAEDICALGSDSIAIPTDVTKEDQVETLVNETVKRWGRVDIIVNNAATNRPSQFTDLPLKAWDIIMKVNVRGVIVGTKAVLPIMMEQKFGHIMTLSSIASLDPHTRPFTGITYDMSKAAVNRFTIGLAVEMQEHNVGVNVLMPDHTKTEGWSFQNPDFDKSNWETPEDWGNRAVYVASQKPSEFTGNLISPVEWKVESESSGSGDRTFKYLPGIRLPQK
ncbi:MAG: SDR family oxidoreductase [Proteobacteria bacterium]|nr:SDR family oxidoreductase [Pseudomonadota bacterium]